MRLRTLTINNYKTITKPLQIFPISDTKKLQIKNLKISGRIFLFYEKYA